MALTLAGKKIERVMVVDDNEDARKALSLHITDANLEPILKENPLSSIDEFLIDTKNQVDAIVCDHKLTQGGYANFNGAEIVANCYKEHVPALLCTAWSKADIDSMRRYLRYIPVLLSTSEVEPDVIVKGIECCLKEFKKEFPPNRIPIQTLIRIEDRDNDQKPSIIYCVVPGWNPNEVVRFPLDLVNEELQDLVLPDNRFFAKVNIGAEIESELYFTEFEYRE